MFINSLQPAELLGSQMVTGCSVDPRLDAVERPVQSCINGILRHWTMRFEATAFGLIWVVTRLHVI